MSGIVNKIIQIPAMVRSYASYDPRCKLCRLGRNFPVIGLDRNDVKFEDWQFLVISSIYRRPTEHIKIMALLKRHVIIPTQSEKIMAEMHLKRVARDMQLKPDQYILMDTLDRKAKGLEQPLYPQHWHEQLVVRTIELEKIRHDIWQQAIERAFPEPGERKP